MMKKAFASIGMTMFLAGCASVNHDCPLGSECDGGVEDTYKAAAANEGNQENVLGGELEENESGSSRESASSGREADEQGFRPYQGGGLQDRPVYEPGQPVRIWLAPWREADGYLRSGQYLYVEREGGWNFGELRSPGAGSEALSPRPFTLEDGSQPNQPGGNSRVQPGTHLTPQ